MGQVIEGRNGVPVDATNDGKLRVSATMHTEHNEEAIEGKGFFFPIDGVAVNGAEHIAVIKNTSSTTLLVTSITLFVATFKDTTRVKVYLNETFTYAAGGDDIIPVNLRSGTVGGAEGVFKTIASAGTDITTFAGTAVIGGIYVFTTTPLQFADPGGWIVPTGQVFSLYNIGNDNTFYGGIDFFYHNL